MKITFDIPDNLAREVAHALGFFDHLQEQIDQTKFTEPEIQALDVVRNLQTQIEQALYDKEVKEADEEYKRHGGPYDRGSADSYYRRRRDPHYYVGGTEMSPKITEEQMTPEQIAAYNKGFDDNEADHNFKY